LVNRTRISLVIVSMIIISIATYFLVSYNVISANTGLIYGGLVIVGTIILESIVPVVLEFSIAPKVSLKIENIKLEKKTYLDKEGYLLTATVTNKGKKIASNLDATIQIKNKQNSFPMLSHIRYTEIDEIVIHSTANPKNYEDNLSAWIDSQEQITVGRWKELRQNDNIELIFPFISYPGVFFLGDPMPTSMKYYCHLIKMSHTKFRLK
jgi:hypothetical protein